MHWHQQAGIKIPYMNKWNMKRPVSGDYCKQNTANDRIKTNNSRLHIWFIDKLQDEFWSCFINELKTTRPHLKCNQSFWKCRVWVVIFNSPFHCALSAFRRFSYGFLDLFFAGFPHNLERNVNANTVKYNGYPSILDAQPYIHTKKIKYIIPFLRGKSQKIRAKTFSPF